MNPTAPFSCLIVDDDAGFVSMLEKVVAQEGGQVVTCGDLAAARGCIERSAFDIVILDNRLPDGAGFDFYDELTRRSPASLVVMVTGAPELGQAVHLTRNGLCDYLTKPLNVAEFVSCLRRARQRLAHPESPASADELIGDSPAMRDVAHSLRQAARHAGVTVLLLGETGTGKDLAARMLHRLTYGGDAANRPYVPLNCSAVPAEMFESELFGSEKGAYTGAEKRRTGLIEAADGGTLFLDEITEMPVAQQAKLLRFLESREYRLLGGSALREFGGRIVAATNRSLAGEVKNGRFREDLMFRLSVAPIRLPALRDHIADLEALLDATLSRLCDKYKRRKPLLQARDLEALRRHAFPGNVRELRNLLERALLHTAEGAAWLYFDAVWLHASGGEQAMPQENAGAPASPLNAIELQEFRLIQEALRAEGGGIRRAANRLGITHQTLLRRLQKWPELRQAAPRAP